VRHGIQFVGLNGGFHRRLSSETSGFQGGCLHTYIQPSPREGVLGRSHLQVSSLIVSWGGYAARGRPEVADMQQVHDRLVISKTLYGAMHAVLRHRPPRGPKPDMIFDNRSRQETRQRACGMLQLQKLNQHGQGQECGPLRPALAAGLQYNPVFSPWATGHQNGYGSLEALRGAHCCNLFSRPSPVQYEAAVVFLANGAVQPAAISPGRGPLRPA
jgi:hypothetical protein